MTPIQQLYLGVGASKKTYLDDVFSTYLYKGTGSTRSINNGIDLADKGGMVWVKKRNTTSEGDHNIFDTVRGAGKWLESNTSDAEGGADTSKLGAFNNNGFTVGSDGTVNANTHTLSSWSFRKAPGFFDIVTYTGNDANRTIAHSLGCVPGLILIKGLDAGHHWQVYHRGIGNTKTLKLNDTDVASTSGTAWNNTSPTATHFSLGTEGGLNANSQEFVAYLFAGGASTAATANSIDLDGTNDYLSLASSSDFAYGTGDFTWEAFVRLDHGASTGYVINHGGSGHYGGFHVSHNSSDFIITYINASGSHSAENLGCRFSQWMHIAISRSSGTTRIFLDGTLRKTVSSDTYNYGARPLEIGSHDGGFYFDGNISNVRIVKGTAVYTSSFKPPTEPLTNVTNTKLLCCQSSTDATAAAVTPGTITLHMTGQAHSTDSPFDDPDAFTFGDAGDQNVIKCGSYTGNGSATGPEINLGWEPQYLLLKNASIDGSDSTWHLADNMRGVVSGGTDAKLVANENTAESTVERLDFTSTGFKLTDSNPEINGSTNTIVYLAIRRPDGYCGKPAEAGTDVFTMDTGAGGTTIPNYDTGFPVDMAIDKKPASSAQWYLSGRLTGKNYLRPDGDNTQLDQANYTWDSNVGWGNGSWQASDYQSWMFKRHAGFDVVAYTGNDVSGHQIPHSLNKTVEMMWVKFRNDTYDWQVYHKGLNGGTNPQNYKVQLNDNSAESGNAAWWNNTAPTSTSFTVGNSTRVNYDGGQYIAMLFASVNGISKVGSYTGSSSTVTVTTGFQPRFVIIKRVDTSAESWFVLDTTRGWGSGNDKFINLDNTSAQNSNMDLGAPTSTGFTVTTTYNSLNTNGGNFIYYAHA